MNLEAIVGLIYNTALLLGLAVLYDNLPAKSYFNKTAGKVLTGFALGLIGIAIMLTPWQFAPGIVFDTRSILLSLSGLFFGIVPAITAVIMTSALRLYQGGAGAWTGVAVIVTSAAIGVAWGYYRNRWRQQFHWIELYLFGIAVHIAMLLWMLTLPRPINIDVLHNISLPVLAIFPVGTVLLGQLLVRLFERRETEKAIQQSEERLRQIVENMPVMLDALDEHNNIIVWNAECERVTGYKAEDIIDNPRAFEMLYPNKDQREQMLAELVERPYRFRSLELPITCQDGTVKTISWSNVSDQISIPGWFTWAVGVDVTNLNQALEHAQKSEAQYADLYENAPDMYVSVDAATGNIIQCNQTTSQMTGFSKDEIIGRPVFAMYHPNSLEDAKKAFQQFVTEGEVRNAELQLRRKDGSRLDVSLNVTAVRDETGKIIQSRSVWRDITERKRTEIELKESEERFRTAFEYSASGMCLTGLDGSLVKVNQPLCLMLGYTQEELEGQHFNAITYPDDIQIGSEFVRKMIAGEVNSAAFEKRYLPKTGPPIWVHINSAPFKDASNNLQYFITQIEDITVRKQSEAALLESEERLRLAMDAANQGLYDLNIQTGEAIVNDEYALMLGYDPATFVETNDWWVARLHPDDKERVNQTYLAYIHGELPEYRVEFRQKMKNGAWVWIASLGKIVEYDADGQPVRMLGIHTNITERKLAEMALAQRTETLEKIYDYSPIMLCFIGQSGQITMANRAFQIFFGMSLEEIQNHPDLFAEVYPDPNYRAQVMDFIFTGDGTFGEFKSKVRDGRTLPTSFANVLLSDGTSIGIGLDISERKEAEEALHRYNQRLAILRQIDQEIVRSQSPEEIVVSTLKSLRTLIPCWRASVALYEKNASEAVVFTANSEEPNVLASGTRISLTESPQTEQLRTGETVIIPDLQSMKTPISQAGQQHIQAGISSAVTVPLMVDEQLFGSISLLDKQPHFFSAEHQEIIEEVANQLAIALRQHQLREKIRLHNETLETRVQQRTAELVALNQELETFTYSVSHDLKAPLRGINGYSQLLLADYADKLDEDGRTFLQNIRHAATQMNQLIEDLLDYSRLERRELKIRPINIPALVDSLIAEHRTEIEARRAVIEINIPFQTLAIDRDGLTIALRNLLENAIKFTRDIPEPRIEIGGQKGDRAHLLWVRDNGIGFDMTHQDRIFEIFQRLHRSENYPGTGIGLAMVRKAMDRLGGKVWAESEPGQGTTFYLEVEG